MYPDSKCRRILDKLTISLGPRSVIMTDEVVLPDIGASKFATRLDISQMATTATMARTERQWRTLLSSVKLKIDKLAA